MKTFRLAFPLFPLWGCETFRSRFSDLSVFVSGVYVRFLWLCGAVQKKKSKSASSENSWATFSDNALHAYPILSYPILSYIGIQI